MTSTITLRPEDLADLAAVDPDGIAASHGIDTLTNYDLDRWSNRLSRIILDLGARPDSRVALALEPTIESVVVGWAIAKIGAVGVSSADTAPIGITTRDMRASLPNSITWLVLDEPATMRRYMTADASALRGLEAAA